MSANRADSFENRADERPISIWERFNPAQRARKREQAFDVAQRIGDIKWQWRQACEVSGLARLFFTPSGQTMAIPMIGTVTLGPPTTFTVRLRLGQLASDIEAVAPRIAEAMAVSGIRVRELPAEWVRIELIVMPTGVRSADPAHVPSFAAGRAWREHADHQVAA